MALMYLLSYLRGKFIKEIRDMVDNKTVKVFDGQEQE